MVESRVWCAAALLCFAACSFPDYRAPGPDSAPQASCGEGTGNPCPSCDDGLQNGAESDVDCGGTCAERCGLDQRCHENADCSSLVCSSTCQPSSCLDSVRNGHETGPDCGGGCPGCVNGSACLANGDCQSGRCQNQVCVGDSCANGMNDSGESDVDCGGSCGPCKPSFKCGASADCESHLCTDGTCSAPSCSDLTQNQGESATDCGGASCAPCDTGKSCNLAGDCLSALCQNGTCVPKYASGQPLSKASWTVSSSEGATEMGTGEAADGDVATCWTSGKAQYSGMHVDVDLGEPQIFFKVLLQVTQAPYDQDFPLVIDGYVSNDGTFGAPAASGIMGNQWTWVDFVGAEVGRYVRFQLAKPGTHPWSIGEINLYN